MSKLSFPRAAIGLTVFLSFSLGWIAFQYYRQQNELVRFFEREATGVDTAKILSIELLDFSTYQVVSRERAVVTEAMLYKVCDESFPERFDLRNEIKTVFAKLKSPSSLSSQEVDQVSRLIKIILRTTLERSNLILDPSFQTYYFVDALFSQFPDVIYYNYSWQDLIDLHASQNQLAIKEEIGVRKAAFAHYQESLKKALSQPNQTPSETVIPKDLKDQLNIDGLTRLTWPLFEAFTKAEKFDQDKFNQLLTQWHVAVRKVIHQGSEAFALLNQNRLQEAQRTLLISLGICLLSWIVSLIFLGFIVHSFLKTRHLMQRVIHDQRDALSKAQKLASLGEMSAGIGHEIANPLAIIKVTTDLLEKNFGHGQPDIYKHSERIRRMVVRIEDIIRNMKSFLSGEQEEDVQAVPVNLFAVLAEVQEDLQIRLKGVQAQLKIEPENHPSPLKVLANHGELVQVFTNLVANAIDAVKDSPRREIHIRVRHSEAFVDVEIQDSGKGIPSEIKEQIFEALFTTKSVGEGTGLGLSIAQKIVSKYHGRLRLCDRGAGACFEVSLNRDIQ